MSIKAYDALSPAARNAVDEAAAATEAHQWKAMQTRVDENYTPMKADGVQVQTGIPA